MDNFDTREAIMFANQCITKGIINDSIIALSGLNEKQNGFEANQYFWEAVQELGLNQLSNETAMVRGYPSDCCRSRPRLQDSYSFC